MALQQHARTAEMKCIKMRWHHGAQRQIEPWEYVRNFVSESESARVHTPYWSKREGGNPWEYVALVAVWV